MKNVTQSNHTAKVRKTVKRLMVYGREVSGLEYLKHEVKASGTIPGVFKYDYGFLCHVYATIDAEHRERDLSALCDLIKSNPAMELLAKEIESLVHQEVLLDIILGKREV